MKLCLSNLKDKDQIQYCSFVVSLNFSFHFFGISIIKAAIFSVQMRALDEVIAIVIFMNLLRTFQS